MQALVKENNRLYIIITEDKLRECLRMLEGSGQALLVINIGPKDYEWVMKEYEDVKDGCIKSLKINIGFVKNVNNIKP